MKIKLLHTITLADNILSATQVNHNEVLVLTNLSEVCKYNIEEQLFQPLFSVKSSSIYPDGGFDINAVSTIYHLDEIVVIVNDHTRHGFIHYPGKYNSLHLWRGEYCAEISGYPIALFKNEQGTPHIIYGADWNHIQIMNLDTRQILTADKSLIEENAEEQHIEFYKNHEEDNKLTWPRHYDYFYGRLSLSPDNKMFLSSGWIWGSFDSFRAYNIDRFLNNHRITDIPIFVGEHMDNRGACWVDENTVAVTYNPYDEGDENTTEDSPHQILFYKINENKSELEKVIQVKGLDIVNVELYYNQALNAFIAISDKIGIAVISMVGEMLYRDSTIQVDRFDPKTNSFLKVKDNRIFIYQLCEII